MKPSMKFYGRNGVAIYIGDVVRFLHNGRQVCIVVGEIRRGCVRGAESDEKGVKKLPVKRWRKRTGQVELAT
jgi:hypothetical protein